MNLPPKSSSVKDLLGVYIKNVALFYLFWMILFQISRTIFFLYHSDRLHDLKRSDIVTAYLSGFPMDLSATTYVFAIPMLLFFANLWFNIRSFTKQFLKWYALIIIGLIATITFADVEIYSNWGYKMNAEALTYLAHPKEAMASSQSSPLFSLILGIGIYTLLFWWLFRKYVLCYIDMPMIPQHWFNHSIRFMVLPITIGLAIIAIRGGVGLSNMGAGHAYHSQHPILNHGATNASWNFLYSIQKLNSESPCQYHFMDDKNAELLVSEILNTKTPDIINVLNQSTPNVVMIVLEGWPVDVTHSFGGEQGITPFFDSLAMDGLRFTNVYSSGDRTYKGVPAVLAGFPAFPSGSIIQYIQKMEQLPCIASSMKTQGYDTHFLYGGDIEFKSISSFVTHCGYDEILSQDDFTTDLAEGSKWGVHDHHVLERAAKEIDNLKAPFFSTILTLSSHEPYDVPIPTMFPGDDISDQFRNSVYYADWSLRQFFEEVKEADWFDKTLFVFTSDHGKPLPIKRDAWQHETFHIPALLYGKPLLTEYRGTSIETVGSQLDIVKTVLNQVGASTDKYKWSRDLLDPNIKPFAFYSFESGVGSVTPDGDIVYDRVSGRLIERDETQINQLQKAQLDDLKAFLQSLCMEFNEM